MSLYRKSKNIGGGVRLNTGRKSVGLSAGVKGARVSVNSKGRIGLSLGIPGTNFRYRKVMSTKKGGGGFICIYFWKFLVFFGKKLFSLIKNIVVSLRRKESEGKENR